MISTHPLAEELVIPRRAHVAEGHDGDGVLQRRGTRVGRCARRAAVKALLRRSRWRRTGIPASGWSRCTGIRGPFRGTAGGEHPLVRLPSSTATSGQTFPSRASFPPGGRRFQPGPATGRSVWGSVGLERRRVSATGRRRRVRRAEPVDRTGSFRHREGFYKKYFSAPKDSSSGHRYLRRMSNGMRPHEDTPTLVSIVALEGRDERTLLALAAGVASGLEPGLGTAILESARERDVEIAAVDGIQETAGAGVAASVGGPGS